MLSLIKYNVTLRNDPSLSWTITAKSARMAKAKVVHRCRTAGSSTLKVSDFTACKAVV